MNEIIKTTTIEDWSLSFWSGDEEPRVQDLDLAARLGYSRPRDIRQLIERMIERGRLTQVCGTVPQTSPLGGRPSMEYYLTEAQALKVAAKSETEPADKLLDEIIRVFLLAKRGELPNQAPKTLEDLRSLASQKLEEAILEKRGWAIKMALQLESKAEKVKAPSDPQLTALVSRFLREKCDVSVPRVRTPAGALYLVFKQFVAELGELNPGAKKLNQTLTEMGYEKIKNSDMFWIGIQLNEEK
jgi:hypothetical protein